MVFDIRHLRTCLGRFPTGVTVVTYEAHGEVRGVTVNAFTAVSLEPPLVLVCLDRRSKASEALEGAPFAINVLAVTQFELALHFAGRPQSHLVIPWENLEEGRPPRLAGCTTYVDCQPWGLCDGGDHVVVVGEVASFHIGSDEPLVFYGSKFRGIGRVVGGTPWLSSLDCPSAMCPFPRQIEDDLSVGD